MDWYWIVLIVVGAIILHFIFLVVMFFYFLFFRKSPWNTEKKRFNPHYINKNDYEALKQTQSYLADSNNSVVIKSYDGLKLTGCFVKNQNAKKNIICFHGYRGKPDVDFGNIIPFLLSCEANVLMVYMRCALPSEGDVITFGIKEKEDVISWINYVNSLNDLPIYLFGRSMGCSSVLYALSKPLGKSVKGVIADCGYYSAYEEYIDFLKKYVGPLARPFVFFINVLSKVFLHLDISNENFLKQQVNNNIPILFSTGDKDEIVPTSHTIKMNSIYEGEKSLYIVRGAKHLQSYDYGGNNFKDFIRFFLEND